MKIIETAKAPNPRRVRIFLHEKQIDMEYEEIDLMSGILKSPEFTAKNPMCGVPILALDDGSHICESVAICRYFEVLHPSPALFGRGAQAQAQIEMWHRRVELGLFFHVAQAFRHLHPAMAALEVPQIADWGQANKPKAIAMLKLLDDQLAGHEFIAGDNYSIADITALVAIDFMKVARIDRPAGGDELSHFERWLRDVSSRPSAGA